MIKIQIEGINTEENRSDKIGIEVDGESFRSFIDFIKETFDASFDWTTKVWTVKNPEGRRNISGFFSTIKAFVEKNGISHKIDTGSEWDRIKPEAPIFAAFGTGSRRSHAFRKAGGI
jgi:hypothetical protein